MIIWVFPEELRSIFSASHLLFKYILLAISFEYICKALLLSKGYKINEYEFQ